MKIKEKILSFVIIHWSSSTAIYLFNSMLRKIFSLCVLIVVVHFWYVVPDESTVATAVHAAADGLIFLVWRPTWVDNLRGLSLAVGAGSGVGGHRGQVEVVVGRVKRSCCLLILSLRE
jgi:hypothetical protein